MTLPAPKPISNTLSAGCTPATETVQAVSFSCWRTIPEEVLSRALYATQFTCQIDKHGYVRFNHWKLYGEHGLAGSEVSVWVYEETLKIEHQATAFSLDSVRLSPDQQHITEVKNAHRLETHFRSPQLDHGPLPLPCKSEQAHPRVEYRL
jgi:hypothetical protein